MGQAATLSIEDVERLSRVAERLAERTNSSVTDAITQMEQLLLAEDGPASRDSSLYEFAASARALRVRRNDLMGVSIFRDPAWDMFLDMLVADHEEREVCVSSLCYGSGVPATTALRTLDRLESHGLISRSPDPKNGRRILVTAKSEALARVAGIVARLREVA